jgi:hypothetical protein
MSGDAHASLDDLVSRVQRLVAEIKDLGHDGLAAKMEATLVELTCWRDEGGSDDELLARLERITTAMELIIAELKHRSA